MHWIQARLLGESPWGWRDAVVRSVHGGRAVAAYVHENGSVSASHHVALDTLVSVGDPIRVHLQPQRGSDRGVGLSAGRQAHDLGS